MYMVSESDSMMELFRLEEDDVLEERDGSCLVSTPACPICGCWGMAELARPQVDALIAGHPIQEVMPDEPAELREQIISGVHPDCFA